MYLANYLNAFCEIKVAKSLKVICSGHILSVDGNKLRVTNAESAAGDKPFDAIVTFLDRLRGLQVIRARIESITEDGVVTLGETERITNTERRMAFRAVVDLPALVTVHNEPSIGYDAIIKDMSVRGILLRVHKAFDVDDVVDIQFPLNPCDKAICNCRCNIVRTVGSSHYSLREYGCDFVDMTPESRDAIKSFMTKKRTEIMQQTMMLK